MRQHARDVGEHGVAGGVAGGVVNPLEVVDVDAQHCAVVGGVAAGTRQLALKLLLEASAVEQSAQLIVVGHVAQALLVANPRGHVACDDRRRHDPPVRVGHGGNRERYRDPASVLPHPFGLEVVDRLARKHGLEELLPLAGALGCLGHATGPSDRLLRGVAVELLGAAVPARDRAVRRLGDDRVAGRLDDVAQQVARRARLGLLGHVLQRAHHADRLAARCRHRLAPATHDSLDVVEAPQAHLEAHRLVPATAAL